MRGESLIDLYRNVLTRKKNQSLFSPSCQSWSVGFLFFCFFISEGNRRELYCLSSHPKVCTNLTIIPSVPLTSAEKRPSVNVSLGRLGIGRVCVLCVCLCASTAGSPWLLFHPALPQKANRKLHLLPVLLTCLPPPSPHSSGSLEMVD